jgi:hypothetical protein
VVDRERPDLLDAVWAGPQRAGPHRKTIGAFQALDDGGVR